MLWDNNPLNMRTIKDQKSHWIIRTGPTFLDLPKGRNEV
jgi:hypothetical protein